MIDLSSNNVERAEEIDFVAVRGSGHTKVMIKATEGTEYVNPFLRKWAEMAIAAKMDIGYYHYARPALHNPSSECAHFMGAVEGLPRNLGAALDLETGESLGWDRVEQWAGEFLGVMDPGITQRILYTNASWLAKLDPTFSHDLWLASWSATPPRHHVWAWQSGQAIVPGCPDKVDVGVFYG